MPIAAVRRVYDTFRVLIHEMAKFGVVGGFNYILDVGVFNALVTGPLDHRPLSSKTISYALATTSSYFLNRHWTWKHRARTGLMREYGMFAFLSLISYGITLAPLGISEYALGQHSLLARNISANVIGTGIAMVFRFWAFKRWVFLDPSDTHRDEEAAEATIRTTV